MTRRDAAREVLDLALDAPVPGQRSWMTARGAVLATIGTFIAAGLAVIGCVVLLYLQVSGEDERTEAAATAAAEKVRGEITDQIAKEFARAEAERNREAEERDARTRNAVCLIIADLENSQGTRILATELGCPVDDEGNPVSPLVTGELGSPSMPSAEPTRGSDPQAGTPGPPGEQGPPGEPGPTGPPGPPSEGPEPDPLPVPLPDLPCVPLLCRG